MPHRDSLPPKMLDLIVDHLHNKRETLRQCCLISKSWVRGLAETNPGVGWSDLDRLLVQLWESRSIRTKLESTESQSGVGGMMDSVVRLLLELTKSGIIDPVELEPISY